MIAPIPADVLATAGIARTTVVVFDALDVLARLVMPPRPVQVALLSCITLPPPWSGVR
ncbi:hypothetical protein [Streptomyces milbemycinicus]|uniref:hypothetical protein n=1 Tax=Streptomyces milbemycinicus TaxID=476552 RepID=UPI0033E0CE8C